MTPTLANLNPLNVNKSKSDVLTWEIHKIMLGYLVNQLAEFQLI